MKRAVSRLRPCVFRVGLFMKVLASITRVIFRFLSRDGSGGAADDNVARPVDAVHAEVMPANLSLPTVWIIGD